MVVMLYFRVIEMRPKEPAHLRQLPVKTFSTQAFLMLKLVLLKRPIAF